MQRRKWDSKTKVQVVMQGIKRRTVAEICSEYQISQNQYYQRRDQFLSNAGKAFETAKQSRTEERLAKENERLKILIGEMTLELKKTTSGRVEARRLS
jgi:transposase-like protein